MRDLIRQRPRRQACARVAAVVAVVVALGYSGGAAATDFTRDGHLNADQRARFSAALQATKSGKWDAALQLSVANLPPAAAKFFTWLRYTRSNGGLDFDEVTSFIRANPDWPHQNALRRAVEGSLVTPVLAAKALAWFNEFPPVSTEGRIRLADLKLASGRTAESHKLLRDIWINDDFSREGERKFYSEHRKLLTSADHAARLDRLLWDGKVEATQSLITRVDPDQRVLAQARIALLKMAGNVDSLLAKVPTHLKNDPGLLFERTRWRRLKNKPDGARDMLFLSPGDLNRPDKWWVERRYQVRRLLHKGHVSDAYRLARDHGQTSAVGIADAEWLAGWIALRFHKDAEAAYKHFTRAHGAVRQPVSVARMAYWAGRAADALKTDDARRWYAAAAVHNMTFYGQLALVRLTPGAKLDFTPEPIPNEAAVGKFMNDGLVWVARALADVGEKELLRTFVLQINEVAGDPEQRYLLASMVQGFGRPDLAVVTAKRALRNHGVFLSRTAFPVIAIPKGTGVEEALLLAVTRQESEFDPAAISSSGARGLMQLMPNTARQVAKSLGLHYDRDHLTDNPTYNLTLGSHHIAELLRSYRGSYVLALAAYNAGPGNVEDWIREWGDPRNSQVDIVDWIELIPFRETRDYIQRILESLQVYRHRLNGGGEIPLGLVADLKGKT